MDALQGRYVPPLDLALSSFLFVKSNDAHEYSVLSTTSVPFASGGSPLRTTMLPSRSGLGSYVSMSWSWHSEPVRLFSVEAACSRPTICCGSCLRSLVQCELMET
jgi:hypothetical protein